MSILIKGMEMPKTCGECFACKAELSHEKKVIHVCCFTRKEYGFDGNHMDDCPLVTVPMHGRLIDADAEIEVWDVCGRQGVFPHFTTTVSKFLLGHLVGKIPPTIIPAEEDEPRDVRTDV